VTVILGDAATDIETPIGRYVERLDNLFDVEDRIASAVAAQLKVTLSAARLDGVRKRDPVNVEAKTRYLEGQQAQRAYRDLRRTEDYSRAEQSYVQAARLSPRYALAYVGLGNLAEAAYVSATPGERPGLLGLMRNWYLKAAEIEPDLAEAGLGLGLAYLYEDNREQAARYTLKALRSDPENSDVVYGVGAFLRSVGLYDRALVHFLKAASLDRLNTTASSAGFNAAGCYWYLGKYAEAEAVLRSIAVLDAANYRIPLNLARQMLMQNRLEDAAAEIARAATLVKGDNASLRRHQAWLAAARGERDRALGLLESEPQRFRYEVTNALCLLGSQDEALRWMDFGFKSGFAQVWDYIYTYLYLANNPILAGLRDEPQFKDLLKRAKSDYDLWTKLCAGL
jgi:tetratricopeptide (TPR) repeat protein